MPGILNAALVTWLRKNRPNRVSGANNRANPSAAFCLSVIKGSEQLFVALERDLGPSNVLGKFTGEHIGRDHCQCRALTCQE